VDANSPFDSEVVRLQLIDGFTHTALSFVAVSPLLIRGLILRQLASLHLHLVRRLPGASDDLAYSAHRLRVRADDTNSTHVMQNVLRRHWYHNYNVRLLIRIIFSDFYTKLKLKNVT